MPKLTYPICRMLLWRQPTWAKSAAFQATKPDFAFRIFPVHFIHLPMIFLLTMGISLVLTVFVHTPVYVDSYVFPCMIISFQLFSCISCTFLTFYHYTVILSKEWFIAFIWNHTFFFFFLIHHLFIAFIVFVSIIVGFRLGESDEAIQIQVTEKAMFLGRTTYFDLQTVDFSWLLLLEGRIGNDIWTF